MQTNAYMKTVVAALMVAMASLPAQADVTIAEDLITGVDTQCNDEDQSGGWNGQSVNCRYSCTAPSTVSIEVQADDSDATVSGSTTCGDAQVHCAGEGGTKYKCDDAEQTTVAEADVKCSGDSDEVYDSGLYVACKSTVAPVGGGGGEIPGTEYWCPVVIQPNPPYPAVCLDLLGVEQPCPDKGGCQIEVPLCDIIDDLDLGRLGAQCRNGPAADKVLAFLEGSSSVTMYAAGGQAFGVACNGYTCAVFDPILAVLDDGSGVRLSTP